MTHGAPAPYNFPEYEDTKEFQFGSTKITLPALKIDDGTAIYILNILGGNPDFITIFATDLLYGFDTVLSRKRDVYPVHGFISAEGKSIPLVYEIASLGEMPYVVLRKSYKPYMGEKVLSTKIRTITTGEEKLYLDNKDLKYIVGKHLIFIDDVISSGATLNACRKIVDMVGGEIVGCLAMATEGDFIPILPTYALCNLPVIKLSKKDK